MEYLDSLKIESFKYNSEQELYRDYLGTVDNYNPEYRILVSTIHEKNRIYCFHFENISKEDIYIYLYLSSESNEIYNLGRKSSIFMNSFDLDKGTYFVNWYNPKYLVNPQIYQQVRTFDDSMNTAIERVQLEVEMYTQKLDSTASMKNRDLYFYFLSKRKKCESEMADIRYKYMSHSQRYLGFYQIKIYNPFESNFFINENAIKHQKISSSPISPLQFMAYFDSLKDEKLLEMFAKIGIF